MEAKARENERVDGGFTVYLRCAGHSLHYTAAQKHNVCMNKEAPGRCFIHTHVIVIVTCAPGLPLDTTRQLRQESIY